MESVAGHLRERNGIYYIVLSYTDLDGKRKTPMITTRLPVKGNKKRAEKPMRERRAKKVKGPTYSAPTACATKARSSCG